MRRALLRLSCLLAAAAAVRDAEDDMDRQLQMFASRYMFATDGQISEGLDREMNDLSLGFRKQRQSARRGSPLGPSPREGSSPLRSAASCKPGRSAQASEPILSRSYGSILPTSLTYFALWARGC